MATTVVTTGLSSNIYATNEKPVDMFSKMWENYPEEAPLLALFSKLSSGETANSRVDWTEREELPRRVVVTAPAAAAASTLTIATDYSYLANHDFLFNPKTFEIMKVQDTALDASVGIIKGWGGTTDSAVESGQVLEILNSSYHEGYDEANPRAAVNTNFYNYTNEVVQFVRTSNRVMNEKTYFAGKGGKRLENQQQMLRSFKLKAEADILFSYRSDTVSTQTGYTSNYIKTMGGLVEKLHQGTNWFDVDGVLTESMLDDWLVSFYTNMPSTRRLLAVCSPKVYKTINQIVKPLIRLSPNSKEYGMNLRQYQGAIDLDLIPHPILTGTTMSGWMIVLNVDYIKLIYQQRPQLELDTYVKRAGYVEDKYSAMMTLIAANEKRHGMAVGIAA